MYAVSSGCHSSSQCHCVNLESGYAAVTWESVEKCSLCIYLASFGASCAKLIKLIKLLALDEEYNNCVLSVHNTLK